MLPPARSQRKVSAVHRILLSQAFLGASQNEPNNPAGHDKNAVPHSEKWLRLASFSPFFLKSNPPATVAARPPESARKGLFAARLAAFSIGYRPVNDPYRKALVIRSDRGSAAQGELAAVLALERLEPLVARDKMKMVMRYYSLRDEFAMEAMRRFRAGERRSNGGLA
jgi:hypothetical protein